MKQITTEEDWIVAAVAGDADAMGELLKLHTPAIRAYVDRHFPDALRNEYDPSDIVQDVFFEVSRRIATFHGDSPGAFLRWLYTVARYRIKQTLRMHNAQKRGKRGIDGGAADGSDMLPMLEVLAQHRRTPSRSAARRELARELETSINLLKADYRKVIQLRHIDELELEEVAGVFGRSKDAVQMLCQRAPLALKSKIGSPSRFR